MEVGAWEPIISYFWMNQGVGLQPLYNFPVILYYLHDNSMNLTSTTNKCNKNTDIILLVVTSLPLSPLSLLPLLWSSLNHNPNRWNEWRWCLSLIQTIWSSNLPPPIPYAIKTCDGDWNVLADDDNNNHVYMLFWI